MTIASRFVRCAVLAALAVLLGLACTAQQMAYHDAVDSPSAQTARMRMAIRSTGAGETLHVVVGHSLVLQSASTMRRVYIGNPAVLQSFTSGPNEIVLTAKAEGISSLVLWDESGGSCLYTVHADIDADALQQALNDAYPSKSVHVTPREGRMYLTGSVATQQDFDGAAKLATTYGKEVMNSLQIVPVHGKQVRLKLRILEVDRSKAQQQGFNIFSGGSVPFATSTGQFPTSSSVTSGASSAFDVSNPLNLFLFSTKLNLGVTIQDLEQKNVLEVLAEPTLTTMSGEPAQFLSGGEFPVPIAQGGGTGNGVALSVSFKPYGVKVAFTPTVNQDGSIRLKLAPEVSTLDFGNAVSISGFTIPALATRRSETDIELRSGQTFAVSGLLDHRTVDNLSHIPGIASIPILGQLFRSKSNTHSVVELVIVVTAAVVDPLTETGDPVEPTLVTPHMTPEQFDEHVNLHEIKP